MPTDKSPRCYLPYPLFDTHFHALHMFDRIPEAETLLSEAFSTNLRAAVEVAVDELNFEKRLDITDLHPMIFLSAGIHPSSTISENGSWKKRFDIVRKQVLHASVVAIGETGLDFFRDYAPQTLQEDAFRDHLQLAAETGLPVIIHNRSADERVMEMVEESQCRSGIFHCFSSNWDVAKKALDLGFHISFAGNLSYKKTEVIREAAARVPSDRLLLETDSPYLSPQAVRGLPNHPGHIGYTLETLAEIRKENPEELSVTVVRNAFELFRIPARGSRS
jgi:TatD DNase family protein